MELQDCTADIWRGGEKMQQVDSFLMISHCRKSTPEVRKHWESFNDESPEPTLMDLCLLDIRADATRKLRSGERTRHIIIVAVKPSAMKGDDLRARAAGCDGYIAKPNDTRITDRLLGFCSALTAKKPLKGNH